MKRFTEEQISGELKEAAGAVALSSVFVLGNALRLKTLKVG